MSKLLKEVMFIGVVILAGIGMYNIANAFGYTLPTWVVLLALFITQGEYRRMVDKLIAHKELPNAHTHQ